MDLSLAPKLSLFVSMIYLCWQLKLLALQNLCNVQVEEITVENCLHASGNDGNDVVETLCVVPVDPVENVEGTVRSKGEQIVAGDRLGLPCLRHHKELGQDSNRFQVDREGPQDFHN